MQSYPKFEDNKVSTKTIIAYTNLSFNIENLFNNLEITEFVVVPKKRGRKKKSEVVKKPAVLDDGSIITLKNEQKIRGVETKKSKQKSKQKKRSKTYFRNSLTVVMIVDNKKINFKLSRNGKFQMTGCKSDLQAEKCVKKLWEMIREGVGFYYDFKEGEETKLSVLFAPAMRNIDFNLGFLIDREKLSRYINEHTKYNSMLEASFGYTGVNIKFPMKEDITKLMIKKIVEKSANKWVESSVPYEEYLNTYPEKEKLKKKNKNRYTTFLLFHSGRAIESGLHEKYMKQPYEEFIEIIRDARPLIEEKLDTDSSYSSDSDTE